MLLTLVTLRAHRMTAEENHPPQLCALPQASSCHLEVVSLCLLPSITGFLTPVPTPSVESHLGLGMNQGTVSKGR